MTLDKLRRAFNALIISEVHLHKGIPFMPKEEIELREAVAELLVEEDLCQELDPREPIQMNLLDLLEKEETK